MTTKTAQIAAIIERRYPCQAIPRGLGAFKYLAVRGRGSGARAD